MKKKSIIIIGVIILIVALLFIFNVPEKILKIIYPIKYEDIVEKYSNKYEVDKYLIYAIIKAESNFDDGATSSKEAKGLMQLMPNTAKDISKTLDSDEKVNFEDLSKEEIANKLLNPELNINLGTKYISTLINKYKSIELALVAYNAGSGNVDNWIEQGILDKNGTNIENVPFKETNNYVRKILRDYKIYQNLYKK